MRISDEIEKFIIEHMGKEHMLDFSRNELAVFFGCVPSQINYVLDTRFNFGRGYIVESQKGGGGYTRLIKVDFDKNAYIQSLINDVIGDEISYNNFCNILERLESQNLIDLKQKKILLQVCSPNSLSNPFRMEKRIRANMLKTLLSNMVREAENE